MNRKLNYSCEMYELENAFYQFLLFHADNILYECLFFLKKIISTAKFF